jgi:RNA polymerase sigma factor (sigma-70 family)
MKRADDLTLIRHCLENRTNRSAFEVLVARYQSHVTALAVNILGDYDDAVDVVQETFVQSFVNLEQFDVNRKFKTWLLGIAVKRCLDLLKKRKSILNYFLKQTSAAGRRCEQYWQRPGRWELEESEIFYPLLKKVKPKERIALVLKMNEDYSAREIAAVLDCTEVTARVHLFNGKRRIKELLAAEGVVGGKRCGANTAPIREVLE